MIINKYNFYFTLFCPTHLLSLLPIKNQFWILLDLKLIIFRNVVYQVLLQLPELRRIVMDYNNSSRKNLATIYKRFLNYMIDDPRSDYYAEKQFNSDVGLKNFSNSKINLNTYIYLLNQQVEFCSHLTTMISKTHMISLFPFWKSSIKI